MQSALQMRTPFGANRLGFVNPPVNDLRALLASRHGLILANARDEERLRATIDEASSGLQFPVWTWSAASGLSANDQSNAQMNTAHAEQALKFLNDINRPLVAVFLDASSLLEDPVAVRLAKEIATSTTSNRTLILSGVGTTAPSELAGVAVSWDLPPANRQEMAEVVQRAMNSLRASGVQVSVRDPNDLVTSILGLTSAEAERLIMREAVIDGELSTDDAAAIKLARAEILSDDSPLDLLDPGVTFADVEGLENLKAWLKVRGRGFEPEAREFGLEAPKGVLLAGVPGCGKSLVARAIAGTWGMSLAALDTGRLHGSLVGESEKRLQRALHAAEAIAPVVLWIDEIEKAFSKPGDNDGGVSNRVLGVLLKWLQERPDGVFIVATSNDVNKLAPEVTRRGRFDEVFFVDLPTAKERLAILAYHLRARKRDPQHFDPRALVKASEGFSGAEIESALTAALYLAYAEDEKLDTERLLKELKQTVPLSQMRSDDVAALRAWGHSRARPASNST
jgi:AAA+ superfamily predicted ATPase